MRYLVIALLLPAALAYAAPDLDRALAERDLGPVRAWLGGLEDGERESAPALRARSWMARIGGEHERAVELMDRALAADPDNTEILSDRANLLLAELEGVDGRPSLRVARELRQMYERALELDPAHVPALLGLYGYHINVPRIAGGRRAAARELLERLERVSPAHWHMQRGTEALDEGTDLAGARAEIERAMELDGSRQPLWRIQLGLVLQSTGEFERAFAEFEGLVAEFPHHALAWYQLGRTSVLSESRTAVGLAALERYLELGPWPGDPPREAAWWRIGQLHAQASDLDAARTAFEQSLELNPDFGPAREALESPSPHP